MRVFAAGLWHETNTFAALRAKREAFESYCRVEGEALLEAFADTNTEIGGALAAAGELGLEIVPGIFAGALPCGPCPSDLFEEFVERIASGAAASKPNGIFLVLHGAMVAEGAEEADAVLVEAVRRATGGRVPIAATFDLHANLSARLVAAADLLVGYRTNPHIDMGERGAEALRLLQSMMAGGPKLFPSLTKVPAVSVSQTQVGADEPMRSILQARDDAAATAGVASASLGIGYPYGDVPHLGMAALVYAADPEVSRATSHRLASEIWGRRTAFIPVVEPVDAAVARAVSIARSKAAPVILVDVADNIGGGTPGDGTVALEALLRAGVDGAVVVLCDAEASRAAVALGKGAIFDGPVGACIDNQHGRPIPIRGQIAFATERLAYRRSGPWMRGQRADHGAVARVETQNEAGALVHVVLTERRVPPYDLEHLSATGLVPDDLAMIVVKAAAGWRVAFEAIMSAAIYLDTPGVHAADLRRFAFRRRPVPLYPLEADAHWLPPQADGARSLLESAA